MTRKSISYFLLLILLTQSCVIYQKTSVSLNEAYDMGKVKVVNPTGEKFKFKKIIKKDSIYYGFNRKKLKNDSGIHEWVDITQQLNADGVKGIYLKDQANSTLATIGLFLVVIPVGIIIGTFIFWGINGVV